MLARLKFLTAGESHGQGLLGILDGMLAGLGNIRRLYWRSTGAQTDGLRPRWQNEN